MTKAIQVKQCSKCCEEKSITDFCRKAESPDGFQGYCKACERTWTKNNRIKRRAAVRRWEKRHPNRKRKNKRYRAGSVLRLAVREGRIEKPSACQGCGERVGRTELHGHHSDYDKPLDVDWLCVRCHYSAHRKEFDK